LKPSNIVLGPGGHPYLIDFNLAGGADDSLQRCGGTLPYMAPERIRHVLGQRPAEAMPTDRADVYSLGAVLFEALTGRVPFEPADRPDLTAVAAELLGRVLTGPPALFAPGVPARLARLVRRCLDPDAARRPTAAALQQELGRFERRWVRRARVVGGLAGVLLLGLAVGWVASRPPLPPEPVPNRQLMPDELVARGMRFLAHGEIGPAEADFLAALRAGEVSSTLALIGLCHSKTGDHSTAAAYYRRAMRDPEFRPAWVQNNLAAALLQTEQHLPQRLEEAVVLATAALDQEPDLRAARYNRTRARFLRELKQPAWVIPGPDARDDLDRDLSVLLADRPPAPDLYYLAAQVLAATGSGIEERLAAAVDHLRTAASLGLPVKQRAKEPLFARRLAGREDFAAVLRLTPPAGYTGSTATLALAGPPSR
jgi:tetratricopeptide (TPR) repeat protein